MLEYIVSVCHLIGFHYLGGSGLGKRPVVIGIFFNSLHSLDEKEQTDAVSAAILTIYDGNAS